MFIQLRREGEFVRLSNTQWFIVVWEKTTVSKPMAFGQGVVFTGD